MRASSASVGTSSPRKVLGRMELLSIVLLNLLDKLQDFCEVDNLVGGLECLAIGYSSLEKGWERTDGMRLVECVYFHGGRINR